MATFKPQLTVPLTTDKWYIRLSSGGYSPCIAGVPLRQKGSALANCVGYAWGRVAYLENDKKCNIGVPASRLKKGQYNPTSAQYWITYANGRTVNKTTPKLGAVMVWQHTNSTSGHLGIVEKIDETNKKVTVSMSGYGSSGYLFRTEEIPFNGTRKNCKFLGYIYIKANFDEEVKPAPSTPTTTYKFKVGDYVRIVGTGNSRADGKGKKSYGLLLKRRVNAIEKGKPYPYDVGTYNSKTKKKVRTGFYPEKSLKKA